MSTVEELLANTAVPINLDQLREAIRAEEGIPIEAGDQTFWIRPPEILTDEELKQIRASDDPEVIARVTVDDYDGFVAAGGNLVLLGVIIDARGRQVKAEQGVAPGESSASSDS